MFFCTISIGTFAQFSPGKLSKPHAQLEGLTNCTSCHTIGAKISNQKCLDCHKELKLQVNKNKGFHVSKEVKGKSCISCHSEHHGVKFDLVRFDEKNFNHSLTGYELKGAHKTKVKECRDCHKPDNMVDRNIKKKPNTFLGLESKCISCHEDYHQNTLSKDCAKCHDLESFKPAPLFDHNKTDFILKGKHRDVDCASCHKSETRNAKKFVKYKDIQFANCTACHDDKHKGQYGNDCKSCHNENSFLSINPKGGFDHSLTGYKLKGKHRTVNCNECHNQRNTRFKEFAKTPDIQCVTCHEDKHEGKLGKDCKACHSQNTFLIKDISILKDFDHSKTKYLLEGKHAIVDCRDCHSQKLTEPLPHNQCVSCHKDDHNGDFDKKKDLYPDCATCHKVEGFSPSLFTLEKHKNTNFKLDGAHVAQPCFSCHFVKEKWVFNESLGTTCVSCHKDIHEGKIDKKYYGKESCVSCHSAENWKDHPTFDHNETSYALKGKHQEVSCGSCHMDYSVSPAIQKFKDLTQTCYECHTDEHGRQFEQKGITDCASCHSPKSWEGAELFDHDKTKYKLDGKHVNVDCKECHKATINDEGKVKLYRIEKYKCIDCHI